MVDVFSVPSGSLTAKQTSFAQAQNAAGLGGSGHGPAQEGGQIRHLFHQLAVALSQDPLGCSATRFLRNRDKKNEKNEGKYLK